MTVLIHKIKQLLEERLLENITLLKMIDVYGDELQANLVQHGAEWGLTLVLPAKLSPYDAAAYPGAQAVIFMAGTSEQPLREALEQLPAYDAQVLKIQNELYQTIAGKYFRLERKRSFLSYTSRADASFLHDADVVEESAPNERLMALWQRNGYERSEISSWFERGARSYSIYVEREPVSSCLTFPNYGRVWEVGAVHTLEPYRGQGLAKKAVSTALSRLLGRGLIPRYQVVEDNLPSIGLAESLGLVPFVRLDHFFAERRM